MKGPNYEQCGVVCYQDQRYGDVWWWRAFDARGVVVAENQKCYRSKEGANTDGQRILDELQVVRGTDGRL